MQKATELYKERKDLNEAGVPRHERDFFLKNLDAARAHAQTVREINRTMLWDVLGFVTCHCDKCQSSPLSDCTRKMCALESAKCGS